MSKRRGDPCERVMRRAAKERTFSAQEVAAAARLRAERQAQVAHDAEQRDFRAEKAARLKKLLPADQTELLTIAPEKDSFALKAGLHMHERHDIDALGAPKLSDGFVRYLATRRLSVVAPEFTGMSLAGAYRALARYAPELWQVIDRCVVGEETQSALAAEMGVSQQAISKRRARALAALELLLQSTLPERWMDQLRAQSTDRPLAC